METRSDKDEERRALAARLEDARGILRLFGDRGHGSRDRTYVERDIAALERKLQELDQ